MMTPNDDDPQHPKRRANPDATFAYAGKKELKAIQRRAWDAGWWPEAKKSGAILWQAPDGVGQVMVHGTASDHRTLGNLTAQFRKAGLDA